MGENKIHIALVIAISFISFMVKAQNNPNENMTLSPKEQRLVGIAVSTAKGNLSKLKMELNAGLEAGLTVNQIKEAIVHIYAYAGFPRSIRGLQTFMSVLDERNAKGINDVSGAEASAINNDSSKYERGKAVLEGLTGVPETGPKTGYAAFAPIIEIFLKEHLFADIFERDVLTYTERELVTVSALSSIGGVEPMLQSHFKICLNVGFTVEQLRQFLAVIKSTAGKKEAVVAEKVLNEVLKGSSRRETGPVKVGTGKTHTIFPKGHKITNDNFVGNAWLYEMIVPDSLNPTQVGSVTFEPGARTKWHLHPGGQILLILDGTGYYQEKGSPGKVIKKGDVVKCPPNVPHWHGASPDSELTHIAIGPNTQEGSVQWLEPVTDEEYHKEYK